MFLQGIAFDVVIVAANQMAGFIGVFIVFLRLASVGEVLVGTIGYFEPEQTALLAIATIAHSIGTVQ